MIWLRVLDVHAEHERLAAARRRATAMMNGQQVWIDDVSRSARPNARRQASRSYSTACTAVFHSKQICAAWVANSLSCQPRSGNWTL
jgi:hypothetical protein